MVPATRKNVRNFGLLFGALCFILSGFLLVKGNAGWVWGAGGGLFFLITGLFAFPVLKPVYASWMLFAFVLGWINTRLLLGAFFYLVLTPIGLLLRLMGKDLLDEALDRNAGSYWKKRERRPFEKGRYERLF